MGGVAQPDSVAVGRSMKSMAWTMTDVKISHVDISDVFAVHVGTGSRHCLYNIHFKCILLQIILICKSDECYIAYLLQQ